MVGRSGGTLLHHAAEGSDFSVRTVQLLLDAGMSADDSNDRYRVPLVTACDAEKFKALWPATTRPETRLSSQGKNLLMLDPSIIKAAWKLMNSSQREFAVGHSRSGATPFRHVPDNEHFFAYLKYLEGPFSRILEGDDGILPHATKTSAELLRSVLSMGYSTDHERRVAIEHKGGTLFGGVSGNLFSLVDSLEVLEELKRHFLLPRDHYPLTEVFYHAWWRIRGSQSPDSRRNPVEPVLGELFALNKRAARFRSWFGSSLHVVGAYFDLPVVQLLLSHEPLKQVTSKDSDRRTALHLLSMNMTQPEAPPEAIEIMNLLIGAGADPSVKDKSGKTAFDLAHESYHHILTSKGSQPRPPSPPSTRVPTPKRRSSSHRSRKGSSSTRRTSAPDLAPAPAPPTPPTVLSEADRQAIAKYLAGEMRSSQAPPPPPQPSTSNDIVALKADVARLKATLLAVSSKLDDQGATLETVTANLEAGEALVEKLKADANLKDLVAASDRETSKAFQLYWDEQFNEIAEALKSKEDRDTTHTELKKLLEPLKDHERTYYRRLFARYVSLMQAATSSLLEVHTGFRKEGDAGPAAPKGKDRGGYVKKAGQMVKKASEWFPERISGWIMKGLGMGLVKLGDFFSAADRRDWTAALDRLETHVAMGGVPPLQDYRTVALGLVRKQLIAEKAGRRIPGDAQVVARSLADECLRALMKDTTERTRLEILKEALNNLFDGREEDRIKGAYKLDEGNPANGGDVTAKVLIGGISEAARSLQKLANDVEDLKRTKADKR